MNGVKTHLLCLGQGSPTVLLEAGLGDVSLQFGPLMKQISMFTRVCTYDRPGTGWSEPLSGIRTAQQTAELFHSALTAAGEKPPYVVAGHSLGGVYSKTFASLYRAEVVGMILIDSAGEDQNLRLPQEILALDRSTQSLLWACRLASPFGIFRVLKVAEQITSSEKLPAKEIAMLTARMNTYHYCTAMLDAYASSAQALSQTGIQYDFGDMPLIVLVRGKGMSASPDQLPSGITMETLEKTETVWNEIQAENAKMSTHSELIVAEESQHYIYVDQPELVVESIQRVVEKVR
ncbi:MAG TPA: alpha/beta hydrolase [Anaerolineales bacterium]|nr:alpha/beta hydrolase [Anaerolineales bacterium]